MTTTELKDRWDAAGADASYEAFEASQGGRDLPDWRIRLAQVEVFGRGLWRAAVCRVMGHQLENLSSIGPDSGEECIACTRCGWGFSHIYY